MAAYAAEGEHLSPRRQDTLPLLHPIMGSDPIPFQDGLSPLPSEAVLASLSAISAEVEVSLQEALTHVHALTDTGRIARADLRALRAQITKAHRAGVIGRRLSRMAAGAQVIAAQPLPIVELLHGALQRGAQDARLGPPRVPPALVEVKVRVDPTLARQLIQALLEWVLDEAAGSVEIALQERPWPRQLCLSLRFTTMEERRSCTVAGVGTAGDSGSSADTALWYWIRGLCAANRLELTRSPGGDHTEVTVAFADVLWPDALRSDPFEQPTIPDNLGAEDSMPLVGLHVLVVTHRKSHRQWVRSALRASGMMLDFVPGPVEAAEFCEGGLPHAILADSAAGAGGMHRLILQLLQETPSLAFIEVTDETVQSAAAGSRTHRPYPLISTQEDPERLSRLIAQQLLARPEAQTLP